MKSIPFSELLRADGRSKDSNGRLYIALLGAVYDCTDGKDEYYGEGKPYGALAG